MRIWPALALAVATFTTAGAALPCAPARPEPVQAVRPGQGAQELLRAAADLDARAGREEIAARTASHRASELDGRARRTEALAARLGWGRERQRLLVEAARLREDASFARADAADAFDRASILRAEANDLRARARQIAGGGGGWKRPVGRVI